MNYLHRVVRGEVGLGRLIFRDYLILMNFFSVVVLGSLANVFLSVCVAFLLALLRMCWVYGMWVRACSLTWGKRFLLMWLLLPITVFEGFLFFSFGYYLMHAPSFSQDVTAASLQGVSG